MLYLYQEHFDKSREVVTFYTSIVGKVLPLQWGTYGQGAYIVKLQGTLGSVRSGDTASKLGAMTITWSLISMSTTSSVIGSLVNIQIKKMTTMTTASSSDRLALVPLKHCMNSFFRGAIFAYRKYRMLVTLPAHLHETFALTVLWGNNA